MTVYDIRWNIHVTDTSIKTHECLQKQVAPQTV